MVDGPSKRHIKMPSSPIMRPTSSNPLISPSGRQSPSFSNIAKKRPRTSSNSSVSSTASFNQAGTSKSAIDSGHSPKRAKVGVHFAVPFPYEESKMNIDKSTTLSGEQMTSSPGAMSVDGSKVQNKQLQPLNLSAAQEEFNKMNLGNKFLTPNRPQ